MNTNHECQHCEKCEECKKIIQENMELKVLLEEITEKFKNKCGKNTQTINNENNSKLTQLSLDECNNKLKAIEKELKKYRNDTDDNSSERQIRLLENKVTTLSKTLTDIKGEGYFLG